MTGYVHLTATVMEGRPELLAPERAAWLWGRLRARFPDALAAALMPRHVHLVVPASGDPAGRLRRTLSWHTRRFPVAESAGRGWEPVPEPVPIADRLKLQRQVRYVHLNPCRAGHTDDPLRWCWSTHRDAVGAAADPWVTADRLAPALGRPRVGFEDWFHGYVSGDPSVAVEGTLPPEPPLDDGPIPLAELVFAAAAALRIPASDARDSAAARRLVVALAPRHGWPAPAPVTAALGLAPDTLRQIRRRHPVPAGLAAAELCLGDPRLLRPVP